MQIPAKTTKDAIQVVIKLIHLLKSLFIKRSCCDSRSQGVCIGASWAGDFVINWKILKFLDVLVSLHPSNPKNLSTLHCEILDFYAPELSSLPIIRADHNIWGLEGSKAYCCPPPQCIGPDHEKNTQMPLLSTKYFAVWWWKTTAAGRLFFSWISSLVFWPSLIMETKDRILIEFMTVASGKLVKCAAQLSKRRHIIVCILDLTMALVSIRQSLRNTWREIRQAPKNCLQNTAQRVKPENYSLFIGPHWGKVQSEQNKIAAHNSLKPCQLSNNEWSMPLKKFLKNKTLATGSVHRLQNSLV